MIASSSVLGVLVLAATPPNMDIPSPMEMPPIHGSPGQVLELFLIIAVYALLLTLLRAAMRRRRMAFSLRSAVLTTVATCFILTLPYHRGRLFAKLVQEDSFVECVTAGLCLASGAILILVGARSTCGPHRVMCIAVGALALFLFGEELDWGQRISGQAVPAFFRYASAQGAQNLHSTLRFVPQMIGLLLFVCWVEVLPFVRARWRRRWLIAMRPLLWQVPERHLFRAAVAMILYQEFFLSHTRGISEVGEACLSLAVLIFSLRLGVFFQQGHSTTGEQPPPPYPEGRADAPSGSGEA